MALIQAKNFSAGYDRNAILKNLNFAVSEGDYLCIVGENGSGKTTLMRSLLGLLDPLVGSIEYGDGLDRSEIGYLPQQTLVQRDFPASVREIVMSGFQGHNGLRPFYTKEQKQTAKEKMEQMGITQFTDRSYRELSGGQQQRVLLARALCATKKLLLLDEPVAGLDPKVTAEMYELIKSLNDNGISIIMISHDISSALKYATHILHIGANVFYGKKEDYLSSTAGKAFLSNDPKDYKSDETTASGTDPNHSDEKKSDEGGEMA